MLAGYNVQPSLLSSISPGLSGVQWLPTVDNQRVLPSPSTSVRDLWERLTFITSSEVRETSLNIGPERRGGAGRCTESKVWSPKEKGC